MRRPKCVGEGLKPPAGRDPVAVLRAGNEGVWWERSDGMRVVVAAPERVRSIERTRLSLVGMLVACMVSDGRRPR